MSDTPVHLTILEQCPTGQTAFIRITGRDKTRTLVQIDMSPEDFLAAVMGHEVIAAYTGGGRSNA